MYTLSCVWPSSSQGSVNMAMMGVSGIMPVYLSYTWPTVRQRRALRSHFSVLELMLWLGLGRPSGRLCAPKLRLRHSFSVVLAYFLLYVSGHEKQITYGLCGN